MKTTTRNIIAVACDCFEHTYDNIRIDHLRKQYGKVCCECGSKIDIVPLTVQDEVEMLSTQLNPFTWTYGAAA